MINRSRISVNGTSSLNTDVDMTLIDHRVLTLLQLRRMTYIFDFERERSRGMQVLKIQTIRTSYRLNIFLKEQASSLLKSHSSTIKSYNCQWLSFMLVLYMKESIICIFKSQWGKKKFCFNRDVSITFMSRIRNQK